MSRSLAVVSLCTVSLAVTGCPAKKSSRPSGNLGAASCDPMVKEECGFPFPSSVYLVADSKTPTGWHVQFGKNTLPTLNGLPSSVTPYEDSDGFSAGIAPMTYLANATVTGLPTQDSVAPTGIALSLNVATSPTLLLEDSNPEDTSVAPTPVAQFSELDANGTAGVDQALMIRPVVRLKDNTRYIVAIRNVVNAAGTAIAPSPVFVALRDGTSSSDPTVAPRAALYANIMAKLKAANVETSNLQIAWDYYTASEQNNTGQLVSMRDQALAAVPSTGPAYTITYHADNPDAVTGRRIYGTIHAPLFLDSGRVTIDSSSNLVDILTGYQLQRDGSGNPKLNGFADFEFVVDIPTSVFTDTVGAPTLIQGHGLFSDRAEGLDANSISATDPGYGFTLQLANDHKYVTVTVDLLGWRQPEDSTPANDYKGWPDDWNAAYPNGDPNQENDQTKAAAFLTEDIGNFRRMIDRGTQGMLNQLVAVKMMETSLANDPLLKAADGHSFIDTTQSYYRGDSQGGILGITFMALSQTCKRGYLGETGMPYNFLVFRSQDFSQFLTVLQLTYGNAMNVQLVAGLVQMFWDRLDGNGFAPYVTSTSPSGLLPNTPSHNVLINDAVGDFQVTPLGAHIVARTVGALAVTPELRPIYGITPATSASFAGNGILEFDFGTASEPGVTIPLTDLAPTGDSSYDPHDKVRVQTATETETDTFFKTGMAQSYCTTNSQPSTCVFMGQ